MAAGACVCVGGGGRERPHVLTMVVVSLQVLDHELEGIPGLVDQKLLQQVLWVQGRHSGS